MLHWQRISLLLCIFGFLKEIRPSEPFITNFLIEPWRNITYDQINRYVFPIGTYSNMIQLIIILLITDLLRYKPLIITAGLSGVIVWSMLIWTKSLWNLQILEIFYGTYMSTEVAYYTYIYAKVDKEHYDQVTSHTRAAILCGRFVAGTLGQVLIYFKLMNYLELNYITLAAQICATLWAFSLPSVQRSLYFHRDDGNHLSPMIQNDKINNDTNIISSEGNVQNQKYRNALYLIWSHLVFAYTNSKVILFSLWYIIGTCGYLQIISYIQVLWTAIDDTEEIIWNGAVEAIITLLGAIGALIAGRLHNKHRQQFMMLSILSILTICAGCSIILATRTIYRFVSYIGYIVFYVSYSFTITLTSAEIAKYLKDDSFGLVFGINTFLALLLQTILTIIIVSNTIYDLTIFEQYMFYGYFYILLGFIYIVILCFEIYQNHCKKRYDDVEMEVCKEKCETENL